MKKEQDEAINRSYVFATGPQEGVRISYTLEIADDVYADYLSNGDLYGVDFLDTGGNGLDLISMGRQASLGSMQEEKEFDSTEIGDENFNFWDKD